MTKNNITRLLTHYPYNTLGLSDTHATIFFDNVEVYTVPISVANKLVNLLNDAYMKGIKKPIQYYLMNQETEIMSKIPSAHAVTDILTAPLNLKKPLSPPEKFKQTFEEKPIN